MTLSLPLTLMILICSALIGLGAGWGAKRIERPSRWSWVPFTALQFLGVLGVLLMLGHLVTLVSGEPFAGRRGF